MSTDINFSYNF